MLAVVGDNPKGLLLDATSGETIAELAGHLDFSFAAAWHPSGTMLATANQVRKAVSAQAKGPPSGFTSHFLANCGPPKGT